MDALLNAAEVRALFGRIAWRYDFNNSLLSAGMHHLWKRRLVKGIHHTNASRLLDICTGTGDILRRLSPDFPGVGLDFSQEMLCYARRKLSRHSALLVRGDALALPFPENSFDIVTISFGLRNLENLERGLMEIRRVLKPGGQLRALEFGRPPRGLWRILFWCYSRTVLPTLGRLISGDKKAYRYLHDSLWRFPHGAAFVERLKKAGFEEAQSRMVSGGIAYLYYASPGKQPS